MAGSGIKLEHSPATPPPANFHPISKAIRCATSSPTRKRSANPPSPPKAASSPRNRSKAAQVGAEVLAAGGDCVDAVIATTFALGVLEPWMSGLGGGGAMVLYRAREDRYEVIDYGMRAPRSLRPEDYPLTGDGAASDIFPWPRVKDDRNLHGPGSIAVPGVVAGMEEAHRRHAKLPWKELLAPSVKLAGEGLAVDWWTTLMISSAAADLRRYPASAAAYLHGRPAAECAMGHQVRGPHAAGPAQGHDGAARQRRPARLLRGRSGAAASPPTSRPPAARCRSKTSSRSAPICASRWRFPIAAARCSRRRNSPPGRRCRARSVCCRKISSPRAADRMRQPTSPMPRRCKRPIASG